VGSAADVHRGTCTVPVGARRSVRSAPASCWGCRRPSSTSSSWCRSAATLNVNAVFGALSNVATGTTVTRRRRWFGRRFARERDVVGGGHAAAQRHAQGRERNTLNRPYRDVGVEQHGDGHGERQWALDGMAAGNATITATSEGVGGTAVLAMAAQAPPPPPRGGAWPNEPAGMTLMSDEPFDALVHGGGMPCSARAHGSGLFTRSMRRPRIPRRACCGSRTRTASWRQRAGRGVLRSVEPRAGDVLRLLVEAVEPVQNESAST